MRGVLIEKTQYSHWKNAYVLENDLVSLVAIPDIGGRIIKYGLGKENVFWNNKKLEGLLFGYEENQGDGSMASWKNYGGEKIWPAPQGWDHSSQWNGPPDPVLDSGCYEAKILSDSNSIVELQLTSPPDREKTGLQITKNLRLKSYSSLVDIEIIFANILDKPISWSIWEIIQLTCGLENDLYSQSISLVIPKNENSKFERGFSIQYGDSDNPQWIEDEVPGAIVVNYHQNVGKIGLDSDRGWLSYCNGDLGTVFVLLFQYDPLRKNEYPDNGCSVECWTAGEGVVGGVDWGKEQLYYLEAEVLSPIYSIEPGEDQSNNLKWGVCKCPGPVVNANKGGCIHQSLHLHSKGVEKDYLAGVFGVFHIGRAILRLYFNDGRIEEIKVGDAAPYNALQVCIPVTMEALNCVEKVELILEDKNGSQYIIDTYNHKQK